MKEQWRKELQEKLANYSQPAPLLSWDKIEAQIKPAAKAKPTITAYKIAAAVALFVVGGATVMMLNQSEETTEQNMAAVTKTARMQQVKGALNDDEKDVQPRTKETTERVMTLKAIRTNRITAEQVSEVAEEAETMTAAVETSKNSTDNEKKPATTNQTSRQRGNEMATHQQPVAQPVPSVRRHDAHTLTAKAYLAGAMIGSENTNMQRAALGRAVAYGEVFETDMKNGTETEIGNSKPKSTQKVKHRQPVRFGISVRYALSNRWSVDGGLAYSRHSSEITSKAGQYESETHQTLNYIGIPISVNYRLLGGKRFNIYASAGGMVEKMVGGKAKTTGGFSGNAPSKSEEKLKMRQLQFSATAGVGAECRLDSRFALYVEPGVSYHFDNGSDLATVYKEKPTNFNLNIGIRFNLK